MCYPVMFQHANNGLAEIGFNNFFNKFSSLHSFSVTQGPDSERSDVSHSFAPLGLGRLGCRGWGTPSDPPATRSKASKASAVPDPDSSLRKATSQDISSIKTKTAGTAPAKVCHSVCGWRAAIDCFSLFQLLSGGSILCILVQGQDGPCRAEAFS